jgi:hypothetical protein
VRGQGQARDAARPSRRHDARRGRGGHAARGAAGAGPGHGSPGRGSPAASAQGAGWEGGATGRDPPGARATRTGEGHVQGKKGGGGGREKGRGGENSPSGIQIPAILTPNPRAPRGEREVKEGEGGYYAGEIK